MGANHPPGVTNLDPRVDVGGHYALLHTKHGRCMPQCFRRFILSFLHSKFMDPGHGHFGHQGHCYKLNILDVGLSEGESQIKQVAGL